ncbi:MAG: DUF4347 domain-containing protein, partial [Burkholderiaceae bacterium]
MSKLPRACPVLEEFEPRILYSADFAPAALAGMGLPGTGEQRLLEAQEEVPAQAAATTEIAFVDVALPDAQSLIDDLQAQRDAGRRIEVVRIESGEDGITRMGEVLAGRTDISAVHVLSHGSDGALQLGSTQLDAATLLARAGELAQWSSALAQDADLLLYGCDLAAGSTGQQLVANLAALTGADVAASDDLTGSALRGGDWTLEFASGSIQAGAALTNAAQQAWVGTLAVTQSGVSSIASSGAVSDLSFAHSINPGSDSLLVVEVVIGNGVDTTSVSYNGTPLTLHAGVYAQANDIKVELWYLVAPPEGAGSIDISVDTTWGLQNVVAGAATFYGVDQTTPLDTAVTGRANTGPASLTVASSSGDMVLDVAGSLGVSSSSVGAGQTELFTQMNGSGPSDVWATSSTEPGASSVDMSESYSGSGGRWAAIAVTINQVGASNTAPAITSDGAAASASVNVAENSTTVTTVTATDADLPAQTLSYSISGTDSARFTIDSSTGVLRFATAPNFEAPTDSGGDNVYDVTVHVSDGTLSDSQDIAVTVTNFNEAPVNTVPPTQITARDAQLVFSAANGNAISVADVDAGGAPLSVTLFATQGTMTLSGTAGLSFSSGTGTANASMTFTGTSADINAALNGLRFTPQAGYTGAATLRISTDDQGASGSGSALADTDLVTISVADASLWLSTEGNATSSAGSGSLSWTDGRIVNFGDPNLSLGAGVSRGTFSVALDLWVHAADLNIDVTGLHLVSRAVTVGTTNPVDLLAGDVLFSVSANETFGGVAVTKEDIVLFRPTTPGDYTSGSFQVVLRNPGGTGNTVRDFALVETAVNVGGSALQAGDFLLLLSSASYDRDIWHFRPTTMGSTPTGGTLTELINGASPGINTSGDQIWGLELVQQPITLGGVSLAAGTLLVSLDGPSLAGLNLLSVQQGDIFALQVSTTGALSTATATMVLRSADVGLTANSERFDAIALAQRASAAPLLTLDGTALAYAENASATPVAPGATVSDADSTHFGGGNLSVYLSNNGSADDQLAILHQGNGAGQIGVVGSDVFFGGVLIGSFSGGTDGSTPLVVSLNASATPAATQALLRDITYVNVSENPSVLPRTLSVVLADGSGGVSAQATRTINVSALNDAPVAAPASASGAEDTLLSVSLTGSDVDGSVASFTVQALPLNGTLYLDAGRSTAIVAGTAYAASAGALTLYFAPAADWNGATSFDFFATDNVGLSGVAASASLTITEDADPPVITSGATFSVAENSSAVGSVSASDADLPAQSLSYSIDAGDDAAFFTIDAASGALSFLVAPDFDAPADAGADNVYE